MYQLTLNEKTIANKLKPIHSWRWDFYNGPELSIVKPQFNCTFFGILAHPVAWILVKPSILKNPVTNSPLLNFHHEIIYHKNIFKFYSYWNYTFSRDRCRWFSDVFDKEKFYSCFPIAITELKLIKYTILLLHLQTWASIKLFISCSGGFYHSVDYTCIEGL